MSARGRCAATRVPGTRPRSSHRGDDALARQFGDAAPAVGAARRDRLQEAGFGVARWFAEQAQEVAEEVFAGTERDELLRITIVAVAQRDRLHRHGGLDRGSEDARVERPDLLA